MGEWRLTDHTAEAGLPHATMWRKGAHVALEQACHGEQMFGLWLGVLHFVHCVHHMRKCVEMAAANVTEEVATDIRQILADFDRTVPDLKVIRDVLEHYEDGYALGVGRAQQPEVKHWLREIDGGKSEEWRAVPDYIDGDMKQPVIRVNRHELQLVPALDAAEVMMWALYRRIQQRDQMRRAAIDASDMNGS